MKFFRGRTDADHQALAEDRALVRGMLAGDQRTFEKFSDEVLPRLYRFAGSRLRDQPELVAEIVQATVCKAIDKLDSWRGEATLHTWLCACCRNEIALYFRTKSRSPQLVEMSEAAYDNALTAFKPSHDPEEISLEQESRQRVHQILDELPSSYGNVLEWKYLEQMSVIEIARRLETSAKAAESLLTRARKAFRNSYHQMDQMDQMDQSKKQSRLAFPNLQNQSVSAP